MSRDGSYNGDGSEVVDLQVSEVKIRGSNTLEISTEMFEQENRELKFEGVHDSDVTDR